MKNIKFNFSNYLFILISCAVSSIITQFVLLREFINLFNGNELVVSVFLSNWFLLFGFGAYIGKHYGIFKNPVKILSIILITLIILPVLLLFIIRFSYKIFFIPGVELGFICSFIFSFVVLFFYCIIQGTLFPLFCNIYEKETTGINNIGKIYFFDNIGNIIGGLVYSFVLIFVLSNTQSLLVSSFLCLIFLIVYYIKSKKIFFFILIFTVAVVFIFCFFILNKFDLVSINYGYPGQKILDIKESKFGRIVITQQENQYNFYENNILLFNSNRIIKNEETIHFAASQCKKINRSLVIGGGLAGTINELLKYMPLSIDYVEPDKYIVDYAKKYSIYKDYKNVNIINGDGRFFLKNTKKRYDLIIVDLPDPISIQLNRFYTFEFFNIVKQQLNNEGVFSFYLTSSENYLNKYQVLNISSLYNTLKKTFKSVIIIPGETNYFISSDTLLSYEIVDLLKEKKIDTQYVNDYYMTSRLSKLRIDYLMKSLKNNVRINLDFKPFVFFNSLKGWLFHFGNIDNIFYVLLFVLLIVILVLQNRTSFIIFTTGFSGAVLEMLVIFSFQIIIGYIYFALGILITFFILGLAAGSYFANKIKNRYKELLIASEIYLIALALVFLTFIMFSKNISSYLLLNIVFFILMFLTALPIGFQFSICSNLNADNKINTGSKLYSADLFGGYFGILLTGIFFIPILGFINVIFLVIIIKILSLLISFSINPSFYSKRGGRG